LHKSASSKDSSTHKPNKTLAVNKSSRKDTAGNSKGKGSDRMIAEGKTRDGDKKTDGKHSGSKNIVNSSKQLIAGGKHKHSKTINSIDVLNSSGKETADNCSILSTSKNDGKEHLYELTSL
jgi:hypothetical protein